MFNWYSIIHNVKNHEPIYDIRKAHREILVDVDDAEQMHSRKALATM